MSSVKTNAMRILDTAKIGYTVHSYEVDKEIDGISVARKINKDVKQVYKTLVTQGASKANYVFVIPVHKELSLKYAAKVVGEKSIEMIKTVDITKTTGYIRGGCSPIGMKKQFKTVIDSSCENLETMIVSAGKIGFQIEIVPSDLISIIEAEIHNIIME